MPYVTQYVYRPTGPSLRQRSLRWLLVAVMVVALVGLALPFWPGFTYSVRASWPNSQTITVQADAAARSPQPPGKGNWLLIPAIGIQTPIVDGPDIGVLDHETGVWHQTGSPAQGNFVIAGHRFKYLPPNQTTFYLLDRLVAGDSIVVWYANQRSTYRVVRSFTVGRDATEILNPTTQPQLTLYTCTDLAASRRLVVIAAPLTR